MKSKATLLLMELLILVLVFSLAAAWCLQTFAASHRISRQARQLDTALVLAQNGAELLKNGAAPQAQPMPEGYRLELEDQYSGIPGLGLGTLRVYYEDELLYSLETGWQEALP